MGASPWELRRPTSPESRRDDMSNRVNSIRGLTFCYAYYGTMPIRSECEFLGLPAFGNAPSFPLGSVLQMSTYTNLLFHIIYSTKYRKPTIDSVWQDELYAYIGGILRDSRGVLLKAGGIEDHIHLLAKLPPTIAVSDMLRLIKTNSSKWINEVKKPKKAFEWQPGYGAFSVSPSQVDRVVAYITKQHEHHHKITFQDEYRAFLKKCKVEYNEQYVWD